MKIRQLLAVASHSVCCVVVLYFISTISFAMPQDSVSSFVRVSPAVANGGIVVTSDGGSAFAPIHKTQTQIQATYATMPAAGYNTHMACPNSAVYTFQQNITNSFTSRINVMGSMMTHTHIGMPWPIPDVDIDVLYGYLVGSMPTLVSKGFDNALAFSFSWISGIMSSMGYEFYVDNMLTLPSQYNVTCWRTQPQIVWR